MEFLCKFIQTRAQKQISPDSPEVLHGNWCRPAEWRNLQGSHSELKAPKGRRDGVVIVQCVHFIHLVDTSNQDPLSVNAPQLCDSILSLGLLELGFIWVLWFPTTFQSTHEVDSHQGVNVCAWSNVIDMASHPICIPRISSGSTITLTKVPKKTPIRCHHSGYSGFN